MDRAMQSLQRGIEDRQNELRGLVGILATHSCKLQRGSNAIKVATIVLSAVSSAKGVADKIYGSDSKTTLILFTLIGILTTVALGFEAAFKLERRAAELNILAASTQGTVLDIDGQWRKEIASDLRPDRRPAARHLLDLQDRKLEEIHQKAAANDLPLKLQVRSLADAFSEPSGA